MLVTISDVQRLLAVSRSQVYKLWKKRQLPEPIYLDSRPRWRLADVQILIG
jgi:predicted DNA-binding transcriptional regulator AlpA